LSQGTLNPSQSGLARMGLVARLDAPPAPVQKPWWPVICEPEGQKGYSLGKAKLLQR
jgi:hypothetical protein